MRAMMSLGPPAAKETMKCTGRDGYVCACAIRDTAGSAPAPATRCKNLRRGSFILSRAHTPRSPGQGGEKWIALSRLEAGKLAPLSPLLVFLCDELGEVSRRAGKYFATQFGHPCLHRRTG